MNLQKEIFEYLELKKDWDIFTKVRYILFKAM